MNPNKKFASTVTINVDESEIMHYCREKINMMLGDIEAEYVFWDTAELKKRTCMCWNTIQDTFFHDPRLIKRKVGQKWYFPVRETKAFLEQWLREQSN